MAAEPVELFVYGFVYDESGMPAVGASVFVEVLSTHASDTATTGSSGEYSVTIPEADWTRGDTVEVTATYNTVQVTNTSVADEFATLQIDIHYDYAIPEFGSFPGVVIAMVLLGSVAVMSIRRRRAQ